MANFSKRGIIDKYGYQTRRLFAKIIWESNGNFRFSHGGFLKNEMSPIL